MDSVTQSNDKYAQFRHQPIEGRLFINGGFVNSQSGKTFDITNPATEKYVATIQEATVEDVDTAVAAAKAAFPAWSDLSAGERANHLYKLCDAVERRLDEISFLEAISMGKPAWNDFTAPIGVGIGRYYASRAWDIMGDSSLNMPGFINMSLRQPWGVTAAIIPWNVPFCMVMMKLGPALVTGNTIVIKTSEKSPLSPLIVAQCCQEVGIPKGVVNFVSGFGRPTGEAMSKHMDIRKISFTGSTATGRAIKRDAANSNLKNVTLELGGKSPLIVFPDADISKAVSAAAMSILTNSGQNCYASTRFYVHADIMDEFIDKMTTTMAETGKSGDPLGDAQRGPQVDKLQFEHVMDFLKYAKDNKLDVPLGGDREGTTGYFIQPTIIRNAPADSRVIKEEIFGPVVCINSFSNEDEVLKIANDSEYGLYSSIFTKDISRVMKFVKKLEAGSVAVNCTSPVLSFDMPFSGWKGSGDGCELSRYATDHWTHTKSVYIAL